MKKLITFPLSFLIALGLVWLITKLTAPADDEYQDNYDISGGLRLN